MSTNCWCGKHGDSVPDKNQSPHYQFLSLEAFKDFYYEKHQIKYPGDANSEAAEQRRGF